MPQELFRLIPNDHRSMGDDIYVVLTKSVSASKPDQEVSLLRFRIEVVPLNYARKEGESQKVEIITVRSTLDAIVDRGANTIDFSISDAEASLPEEIRGGGVGSYVVSEMIRWGQGISAELKVIPIRISSPENAGSGRESKLKVFFEQMGFTIVNKPNKGLFAAAESIATLKPHVNPQKIEKVNLLIWGNEWLDSNVSLANQLKEESQNVSFYKEQASNLRNEKPGRQTFWAGLLMGVVAGIVLGVLIAF
ncbi:MAG: hypothetical protein MI976_09275 [Pseudomonadales bacterium]|nr:hypothetical protein [Pseudomonadales bacterium]